MGYKIFTATQGTIMVVEPAGNQRRTPFALRVDNAELGPTVLRGIVTGVSLAQDTNVQFMHSLRDTIYINVFGNKIGQMSISGILFMGDVCPLGYNVGGPIDQAYNFYIQNNVVNRAKALPINLGTKLTFKAFLLSFQCQVMDPQTSMGQFTMNLAVVPKAMV